jgi:predicted transcriptional regulator
MSFELNHKPHVRFITKENAQGAKNFNELLDLERKGEIKAKKVVSHKNIIAPTAQGTTIAPDFYSDIDDLIESGKLPENLRIWFDFTKTLEEVDLVYKRIYQTVSDKSLPETILVKDFAPITDFFFTQVLDGEAVLLNDIQGKGLESINLQINAGGWIKSMREELFGNGMREMNMRDAAARGYRNYLNAIYMNPIVSFAGVQDDTLFNATSIKATPKGTMTWFEKNWHILKAMKNAAAKYKVNEKVTCQYVPVMNEVTASWFEDAVDAIDSSGNKRYPSLMNFFKNVIIYNGATMKDLDKTVVFSGIADGVVMYVPIGCKHFVEFEKIPLTLITDNGLANNLGHKTSVMYDCRGMYATTSGLFKAELVPLSDTNNTDSPLNG